MVVDLKKVQENADKIFKQFQIAEIKAQQEAAREASKPKSRAAAGVGIFTKKQLQDANKAFIIARKKRGLA